MLNQITLKNFKASRDISVDLAHITVLSGLNGSGKSSLLQALALLRQSYFSAEKPKGLILNGDLVQLGQGKDVLHEWAADLDDEIAFEITEDQKKSIWSCKYEPGSSFLDFKNCPTSPPIFTQSTDFQFLCADRVSPRTLYPQAVQRLANSGFLGVRGEYTADFLARNAETKVSPQRALNKPSNYISESSIKLIAPTDKLSDQVSAWFQVLSPGVKINAEPVKGTDDVRLHYTYVGRKRDAAGDPYRPTNVGFGLTYSLPMVVACLASRPGALLLLENPEAHLHPQGQQALGELLALCAADGVQIIVETHSDHLLNGIRVATKKKILTPNQVSLNFFSRPQELGEVKVEAPVIFENGKLSNWPPGFFDQWEKGLDELVG